MEKRGKSVTSPKINNKKVTSVEDLVDLLKNAKDKVMLEGVYEDYPGNYYYAFGL